MNESKLTKLIREELTKQEVNNIISDKLSSYLKKNEIEREIKNIVTDVMEKFFRLMYNKRGFWKNDIKNG